MATRARSLLGVTHPGRVIAWSALIGGLALYFAAPSLAGIVRTRVFPDVARIDLGTIKQGTIVKTKARFWNLGLRPLQIQNISSSCGCTAATAGARSIPPLSSTEIKIELDTYALEGAFSKSIQVEVTPMGKLPAQIELIGRIRGQ